MKSLLIVLVVAISTVGCRAVVPASFFQKMEKHNNNMLLLNGALRAYLLAEITLGENSPHLQDLLKLANDDMLLTEELVQWAKEHKWSLALD